MQFPISAVPGEHLIVETPYSRSIPVGEVVSGAECCGEVEWPGRGFALGRLPVGALDSVEQGGYSHLAAGNDLAVIAAVGAIIAEPT
jgi:hypothetical protein